MLLKPIYRMAQHLLGLVPQNSEFYPPKHRPCKDQDENLHTRLDPVYDAWLASRAMPQGKEYLAPGARRPFNRKNAQLALILAEHCAYDLYKDLIGLHPNRTALMLSLNVIRSLSPAFRGYCQALALNELQSLITAGDFTWAYLARLIASELLRRVSEALLESFASSNENIVYTSARYFVEYQQIQQRVRLDLPTLADPTVRDLLQESELFARSLQGAGGFGLLSPLDVLHIVSLCVEVVSQIWVLITLTGQFFQSRVLLFSVLSTGLPLIFSWSGLSQTHADPLFTLQEARAAEYQEKMRNLAYSDVHRPEVVLFGLGPWILRSWAAARNFTLTTEKLAFSKSNILSACLFANVNFSDFFLALQNVALVFMFQSSPASLGSIALYRNSIQSVVFAVSSLISTVRMAFQAVFPMGAFCIAMKVQPRLHPKQENYVEYKCCFKGTEIEIRNLSYTYPGSNRPALSNVNLKLMAGESLAIVGYNGSGKSTLAKIILRIVDFDEGKFLVNGVDIRRYNPVEYHQHITAVFQGFSKFDATVKENVGVGFVERLRSRTAVEKAIRLAGGNVIIDSLPNGLKTQLDASGLTLPSSSSSADAHERLQENTRYGLSGGEWQRIAISRAFMRADRPEVDLLLFDEPTSSLDAHAQNEIFDTIERISRSSAGEKIKTVVFITHRLSTARRADKVAMMENGTISEFGTHEELLRDGKSYASLYLASV